MTLAGIARFAVWLLVWAALTRALGPTLGVAAGLVIVFAAAWPARKKPTAAERAEAERRAAESLAVERAKPFWRRSSKSYPLHVRLLLPLVAAIPVLILFGLLAVVGSIWH